jgi:adenylate cyclase
VASSRSSPIEENQPMTIRREIPPSASKKSPAPSPVSPLDIPARAVESLRAIFGPDGGAGDRATLAGECAEARTGTGLEPPEPGGPAPNHLHRSFLFIDVTGFSAYVDSHGEHAAIEVLTRFRSAARDVSARRGVRVGKWLGDGVMLVGTDATVVAASAAEVWCRLHGSDIDVHAGLASGPVLLFEGDDYIGRPVNLAARLCDAAGPGEILAAIDPATLPPWVVSSGEVTVQAQGIGDVEGIQQLSVEPSVLAEYRRRSDHLAA